MPLSQRQLSVAADLCIAVYLNPDDWLVHSDDTTTWIAIEGSDELADWRRNFEFILTSTDEHLGFGSYARDLMAQMWAHGIDLNPTKPLVVCGHSLGGAVATIIAAQLQSSRPMLELVTFGSPRPGGKRFRQRLKVPHHRYVHADDVVPHMPLWAAGFRHTAPALMLEQFDGNVLRGIKDHDMNIYRTLVRGL